MKEIIKALFRGSFSTPLSASSRRPEEHFHLGSNLCCLRTRDRAAASGGREEGSWEGGWWWGGRR